MKEMNFKRYIDAFPEGLDQSFCGFNSSSKKFYASFSHPTKLNFSDIELPKSYSYLSSAQELFLILKSDDEKFISKLSTHLFENVAKFKALNFLMFNFEITKEILGISDLSEYSIYDQKNNSLRSMIHIASAFFAGLNEVKTYPYDHYLNSSSESAKRLVSLSFDVLSKESHLGQVNDPLKGSYYVEARAGEIAQETFELLKEHESETIESFKSSGKMKSWMAYGAKSKRDQLFQMGKNISGVNNFINFEEILNESDYKSHSGSIFSLEKIRSKVQSSKITACIYCFGELKDYLKKLALVSNIYNSLGIKVEVLENTEHEQQSDFYTLIGNESKDYKAQEVLTEILLSKNLDLVLKELNKNKRFISSL